MKKFHLMCSLLKMGLFSSRFVVFFDILVLISLKMPTGVRTQVSSLSCMVCISYSYRDPDLAQQNIDLQNLDCENGIVNGDSVTVEECMSNADSCTTITMDVTGDGTNGQPVRSVIRACAEAPSFTCVPPSGAISFFLSLELNIVVTDIQGQACYCSDRSLCNDGSTIGPITAAGDTTLPVISGCPLEPVVGYTAVGVPSTVNWVPPTATDADGGAITTTSTHDPNHSVFPPASTTFVTYTFTDTFGNAAQCTFQVILLEDRSPPIVEYCPSDIMLNLDPGMTQGIAQWIAPTGMDNSGLPVTVERNGLPSESQFPIGDMVITYTLTDSVGLTAVCTFTVSVRDVTPPQVLNCPTEDIVRYTMTAPVFIELPVLEVTDDTGVMPTLVSNNVPAQSIFSVGSLLVLFVYSDGNGNIATCTYTVTVVVDNTAPVVVCPDVVRVFVPTGVTTIQVTYPNPTVSDNSGLTPTLVTTTGIASGGLFPSGTTSFVSFLYEDAAGNQGSCTLQVAVTVDSIPPTLSPQCTPTEMAFASSTNRQVVVNFAEPAATDDSGLEITMTVNGLRSGSLFPVGVSTTIYTFTDSVGNSKSCQTVVTVEIDVTPPTIIHCPANIVMTVANTETQLLVNFATPTATDNSGEPTRLSSITGVKADNMYPVGTTTITYTFEDNYGNSAICQFAITISQEVCNPSLCAANEMCTSDGGNPPVAVCTPTAPPDTTAPVISGCPMAAITQTVPTTSVPVLVNTPVPTATDDSNQAPTVSVNGLPANNLFPEGTTAITYTFTDASNNQASCTFSVIIDVDYCSPNPCPNGELCTEGSPVPSQVVCSETVPAFQFLVPCPSDMQVQIIPGQQEAVVTWQEPIVVDSLGNVVAAMETFATRQSFPIGTTTITYRYSDSQGNSESCSFDITVRGSNPLAPFQFLVPCPSDIVVSAPEGQPGVEVSWREPVLIDSQGNKVDAAGSAPPMQFFQIGTSTILYTYSDSFGNTDSCSFDIIVQGPAVDPFQFVVPCPDDKTVTVLAGQTGVEVTWQEPVVTDSQGNRVTVTGPGAPMQFFLIGTSTIMYQYSDNQGNTGSCSFNVVVQGPADTMAPTIVVPCPANINLVAPQGSTTIPVNWTEPSAIDGSGSVKTTNDFSPGDGFPIGTTAVRYTFADAAGNSVSCSFFVTIEGKMENVDIIIIVTAVSGVVLMIGVTCSAISLLCCLCKNRSLAKKKQVGKKEQPEPVVMYSRRIEKDYADIHGDRAHQSYAINSLGVEPESSYQEIDLENSPQQA